MDSYSFQTAPRLRVQRNSHLYSDRSQVASTIEGPSRFPEQTQLLDVNMNDVAMSETTEQSRAPSSALPPAPPARSPTPAEALRALMARLPANTSSTPRAPSPSPYDISERESDFDSDMDTTDLADVHNEPSSAQRSVATLFQNARSDYSFPSRKGYSSRSPSEKSATGSSMVAEGNTTGIKGKQASFLADDNGNANPNESIARPVRRRPTAPPLTQEFLRERFSESRIDPEPPSPGRNSSNETATILHDMSDLNTSAPQATSTPMQSLQMSFSGQFQSNLLDQDTEMQRAIDDQDSSNSVHLPQSSPPTVRRRPMSRQGTPSSPGFVDTSKTPTANTYRLAAQLEKRNRMRSPSSTRKDTLHQPSSPDWEQTPRPRRPAEDHRSDIDSDDEENDEEHNIPRPQSRLERDDYSQPSTSYRSQATIPRNTVVPHISINGHRSVSLSRGRSPSVSSTDDQNEPVEEDEVPESEPEATASRLSYAYSTPRSTYMSHPATARRVADTSRTTNRLHEEEDVHTQRSTTPTDSPGRRFEEDNGQSIDQSVEREPSRIQRSTTPNDSPGRYSRYDEPSRSRSPMPSEQPSSMNRTSSLQNIDNTYHIDPSERNLPRAGSITPASVKKQSSSYLSAAASSPKSLRASPVSSPRNSRQASQEPQPEQDARAASPQPSLPRMKSTSRFMSASPPWSPVDEEQSHLQRRAANRAAAATTAEVKRPSFASETTKLRSMFSAHLNTRDDDESYETKPRAATSSSRQQEKQPESRSNPNPVNLLDDRTPPSFQDVSLTPPRNSSTPRNNARAPQSPSTSVVLPDLPTPSSSDESETEREARHQAPVEPHQQRNFATPRPGASSRQQNPYEASWMPTPKPPGGWLQTPMPARQPPPRAARGADRDEAEDRHAQQGVRGAGIDGDGDVETEIEAEAEDEADGGLEGEREPRSEREEEANHPKTPMRYHQQQYGYGDVPGTTTKTPRFPGAWRTPAPAVPPPRPAAQPKQESVSPGPTPAPAPEPSSNFSTSSLHAPRSHAQEQRHQGLLTPVNSLSRGSGAQDPKTPYVTGGWVNTPAARKSILKVRFNPKQEGEEEGANGDADADGAQATGAAPSTPHRSIRVLDAFGREQGGDDSRAEDEDEEGDTDAEDRAGPSKPKSRADILQDIRRTLDGLKEDMEEIDSESKARDDELVRIEELSSVSRRARDRRAQLESESGKSVAKLGARSRFRVFSPNMFSTTVGLRFYLTLFLVQVFLVLLMYRLSVIRAKHLFLSSYYDPFNPIYALKYDDFLPSACDISGSDCYQSPLGHLLHTNLLFFLGYLRSYLPTSWAGVVQQAPGWWPS